MTDKLKIAGIYVVWNNHVLIHKRSTTAGSPESHHKFASPGGKVDPEDDGNFKTAALRELKEETGLVGKESQLSLLNKIESEKAVSKMFVLQYKEKPTVKGPDKQSKKSVDMEFDFAKAGVKGEDAGPGYYWANLKNILTFLKDSKNEIYNNPYFVENIKLLKQKQTRGKTRKISK